MSKRVIWISAIIVSFLLLGGIGLWLWTTPTNQVTTPPAEDTPELLIDRLAVAYDERDWDVYETVYTERVQRFLKLTCGNYKDCFTEHRDTVESPITYEIWQQTQDDEALVLDVEYIHPDGTWCQTYTIIDTEYGYRVDFSTTPTDCPE